MNHVHPPDTASECGGAIMSVELIDDDRSDRALHMVGLVPALAAFPRQNLRQACLFTLDGQRLHQQQGGSIDTVIITGGETDVCVLATSARRGRLRRPGHPRTGRALRTRLTRRTMPLSTRGRAGTNRAACWLESAFGECHVKERYIKGAASSCAKGSSPGGRDEYSTRTAVKVGAVRRSNWHCSGRLLH